MIWVKKCFIWATVALGVISWVGAKSFAGDIDWEGLSPHKWLNLKAWREGYSGKTSHREQMGRLIQCVGECRLYRGVHPVRVGRRSLILEGDEIETARDSYAWVLFWDGSLLRISPESGLSFREFNVSEEGLFLFLRVAEGHIFLSNPRPGPLRREKENLLETDPLFRSSLAPSMDGVERPSFRPTHNVVTMGNATLYGKGLHLEIYHIPGRQSFLQQRRPSWYQEGKEFFGAQLWARGEREGEMGPLEEGSVYEVGPLGLQLQEASGSFFSRSAQLLRRVPSILGTREQWLQKYVPFLHQREAFSPELLIQRGFRLWGGWQRGEEMGRRLKFLRVEIPRQEMIYTYQVRRHRQIDGSREVGSLPPKYFRHAFLHYLRELNEQRGKD